jgi:prepilin-type processing-associated H-X9-DG protein
MYPLRAVQKFQNGRFDQTGRQRCRKPPGVRPACSIWSEMAVGSRIASLWVLGETWAVGTCILTMGNVLLAPNPPFPNWSSSTLSGDGVTNPGMYTLSSFHSGGGNILMTDGSVRFLKSNACLMTVWALGSRNGGEVFSADSY